MANPKLRALAVIIIVVVVGFGLYKLTNKAGAVGDPSVVGAWSGVSQWPIKATHAHLLPDGTVMIWPSSSSEHTIYIWNPVTNVIAPGPLSGFNLFCAGHTITSDGKLFVAGGHVTRNTGIKATSVFDPAAQAWSQLPDMNNGRWYPNVTALSNGDLLVVGGTVKNNVTNTLPQIWDVSEKKWKNLTGAKLDIPSYSFMFPAPNGGAFNAGPDQGARFLDINGNGKWGKAINSAYGDRQNGTAVMYEPGKIIIVGGVKNPKKKPTNTAELIDLNAASPKWTKTGSMSTIRRHANGTLLPTGEVLVTGGTTGVKDDASAPVFLAESWTPSTGTWKQLASNATYRGYHSIALLLPDARVLIAGGELSGTSMEIYSPAYLFKGARPTIASAPAQVNYGETFSVETPDAANIASVRLIRIGSVTHSINMSQVIDTLSFTKQANGLQVTATPLSKNGTITPGIYMLFILNDAGVPSVASMIQLGDTEFNVPAAGTFKAMAVPQADPTMHADHEHAENDEEPGDN
ncbi:MAG: DUF1929 domain-containing protein [Candidatus Pacebacteria bacterium]|nr:DUF1929 domain-containing protein [Candidatus Paceibacterota bacterium]